MERSEQPESLNFQEAQETETETEEEEEDFSISPSMENRSTSKSRLNWCTSAKDLEASFEQDPEATGMEETDFDDKSFEIVQKMIKAGQVEKLKVEQCKVYLRRNGLRLTGNKGTLTHRIKEHRELLGGKGEKMYPVSSFVLNCKGDGCAGDVVLFEQNVYEMYDIVSRSASGAPCGKRIVVGRIVKESYGAAKQQHTFTNYPVIPS